MLTGGIGAFVATATIESSAGPLDICLRVGAALLATSGALAGLFDIHRLHTILSARGRSISVHGGRSLFPWAVGLASLLFVTAMLLATAVELASLALRSDPNANQSPGMAAVDRARQRMQDARIDNAQTPGGDRFIGPDANRRSAEFGAEGGVGNLLSDTPILEIIDVRGIYDDAATRSLHMRGFVLDTFARNGVMAERSGSEFVAHAGEDGWVEDPFGAASGAPAAREHNVEDLRLEFRFRAPTKGLIFSPHRLLRVETPLVDVDVRLQTLKVRGQDVRRFVVDAAPAELTRAALESARARGSLGSDHPATLLPDAREGGQRARSLARLEGLGRVITGDTRNDLERVLRVVEYLRTTYGYELYDTRFLAPEGCVALIDRGTGSCTHFASFATLVLRQLDIPTRIAAGYVARERLSNSPDRSFKRETGWLVRERDGHAWIEVHFEGFGWLTFDPTPGDDSVGGAQNGWTPLRDEPDDASRAARQARTSPLAELALDGIDFLRNAGIFPRTTGALRFLPWIMASVLGLVLLGRLLRRPSSAVSSDDVDREAHHSARVPAETRPNVMDPSVSRLMAALESRGLTQPQNMTPIEFGRSVEEAVPEAQGLPAAISSILRSICLGESLTPEEQGTIERLGSRISKGQAPPQQ